MFSNNFQLSTEQQLNDNGITVIEQFWANNAQASSFYSVDNTHIHTVSIKTGNHQAIVISQGRNESTLKYKELAFDLNRQGYDLYLIDHRGQGLSQRLGGDNYRGHVQRFQDYVDDLDHYVSALNLTAHYQSSFLLSHSMGGAVAALYLQQFNHPFQASIFFSPMFAINLSLPRPLAKIITYSSAKLCSWFVDKPCYVFGGHNYHPKSFTGNDLTTSQLRFNIAAKVFVDYPQSQLGSPTMHWVSEGISAAEQAINQASKITIPILLIQAGADTVVSNKQQRRFYKNLSCSKKSELITIAEAQHEILIEQDQYRVEALNKALQFLKNVEHNN